MNLTTMMNLDSTSLLNYPILDIHQKLWEKQWSSTTLLLEMV